MIEFYCDTFMITFKRTCFFGCSFHESVKLLCFIFQVRYRETPIKKDSSWRGKRGTWPFKKQDSTSSWPLRKQDSVSSSRYSIHPHTLTTMTTQKTGLHPSPHRSHTVYPHPLSSESRTRFLPTDRSSTISAYTL